ncbi:MAG: hypothetical protein Q9227_001856 [Pyrenula ochraceoflavens]
MLRQIYKAQHNQSNIPTQLVAGLRDLLEHTDEDDTDQREDHAGTDGVLNAADSVETLIFGHETPLDEDILQPPTQETRAALLRIYRERVDRLFKATHWPTVVSDIEGQYIDSVYKPSSPSTQALEFAIYFMAICALNDKESKSFFLSDRNSLLRKYKNATEVLVSRAKVIEQPDFATALGLPMREDHDIENRSVQDIEISRRVWFCIGSLDSQTSLDRGFKPLIPLEDFNSPPAVLDDLELSVSAVPQVPPQRFTDMSFCHVIHHATMTMKRLCALPVESQDPWSDWNDKLRSVISFEKSMRQHCERIGDSVDPLANYMRFGVEDMALNLHLLLRRPPFRQMRGSVPPWDDYNILNATVSILERSLWKSNDSRFAQWNWFAKAWVRWHALAILLVELCAPQQGKSLEKAWKIAQASFEQYGELISSADSGMLWKPIARLMKVAVQVRSGALQPTLSTPQSRCHFRSGQSNHESLTSSQTLGSRIMEAETELHGRYGSSQIAPLVDSQNGFTGLDQTLQLNSGCQIGDGHSWVNWEAFLDELDDSYNFMQTDFSF